MERAALTLVDRSAEPRRVPAGRGAALALGFAVVACALLSTGLGADRARRPIDRREIARATLLRAIEAGLGDADVQDALVGLRRDLGRRPTDARTRSIYAALLLGLSRGSEDHRAAAFHAARAAASAPVTVPVIRDAANVLVRAGDPEGAIRLVHDMFLYDPDAGADLLALLEPFLDGRATERALPGTTDAWLGWWAVLRRSGRDEEADRWLGRVQDRWPDDPQVRERVVAVAYGKQDWNRILGLLPGDVTLPSTPAASRQWAYRAVARAETGDDSAARSDAEVAGRLGRDDPTTLAVAARALERVGEPTAARDLLARALYALRRDEQEGERLGILVRLARLEDRDGTPAAALRAWRAVLEIDGEHREATRRVDDLTGFNR